MMMHSGCWKVIGNPMVERESGAFSILEHLHHVPAEITYVLNNLALRSVHSVHQ